MKYIRFKELLSPCWMSRLAQFRYRSIMNNRLTLLQRFQHKRKMIFLKVHNLRKNQISSFVRCNFLRLRLFKQLSIILFLCLHDLNILVSSEIQEQVIRALAQSLEQKLNKFYVRFWAFRLCRQMFNHHVYNLVRPNLVWQLILNLQLKILLVGVEA